MTTGFNTTHNSTQHNANTNKQTHKTNNTNTNKTNKHKHKQNKQTQTNTTTKNHTIHAMLTVTYSHVFEWFGSWYCNKTMTKWSKQKYRVWDHNSQQYCLELPNLERERGECMCLGLLVQLKIILGKKKTKTNTSNWIPSVSMYNTETCSWSISTISGCPHNQMPLIIGWIESKVHQSRIKQAQCTRNRANTNLWCRG